MLKIYWLNPPLTTKSVFADLAWMNFKTVCPEYQWIEPILDWTKYKNLDQLLEHIVEVNPDVLCISTYIWNIKLCHTVAEELKKIKPNLIVIKGGPQQGYNDNFFNDNPYIDYLCFATSHGEYFLQAALKQIDEHGKIVNPESVPFLISRDYHTQVTKTKFVYDETVSPIEQNIDYILKLRQVARERNIELSFFYETTRGCPYSCVYCEWGGGVGSKVSQKSLEMIERELEILAMLEIDLIEITDANFGILDRDNDLLRIAQRLKEKYGSPKSVYFYGLAKVRVDKKEKILDTLFETGFMEDSYNMALQSVQPEVLKNAKRFDISLEESIRLAEKYKNKGVSNIKPELILGLPGANLDGFYKEMDIFQKFNSWEWPRNIATVLPNTELASEEYQKQFSIKTVKIGSSENEEAEVEYIDYVSDSIIREYKSSIDIVIETYSYSIEDWKEMFFMNRAQRILGPLVPADEIASVYLRNQYQQIRNKKWFEPIEAWLNMLVEGQLHDQDMVLFGNNDSIEGIVLKHVQDI